MALNPELLALLACPVCRGELEPVDNESGLECPACGLVFPVRDNIPIMLQEEAIRVPVLLQHSVSTVSGKFS